MKLKSTLIVAMTAFSATAFAQDNSGAVSAPVEPSTSAVVNPAQSATAAPAATSTLSLTETAPARKIKVDLFHRTFTPKSFLNNGQADISSENYIGLKGSIAPSVTVGLRQYIMSTNPAVTEDTWKMEDTMMYLTHSKLAALPADATLSGNFRIYLPTGESARVTKEYGKARAHFTAAKSIGKFDLGLHSLNQFYGQTQDVGTNGKANREWYLNPYADVVYNLSDKVSFYAYAGPEYYVNRTGPNKTTITMGPGVTWAPIKALTVDFSIDNTFEANNGVQAGRDEDLTAVLAFAASI